MWGLYDRLIDVVPEGIPIEGVHQGTEWSIVKIQGYAGMASVLEMGSGPPMDLKEFQGRELHELAMLIKEWDFARASIGAAAINAWISHQEPEGVAKTRAFDDYIAIAKGEKVGLVGHFFGLEHALKDHCQLSILEKNPFPGDYPESACEYILPEQDVVFLTGQTLINKTLPRLLQLSQKADVIMIGPSVPMTDVLFDFGVDELAGMTFGDVPADAFPAMCCNEMHLSEHGQKMRVKKTGK